MFPFPKLYFYRWENRDPKNWGDFIKVTVIQRQNPF